MVSAGVISRRSSRAPAMLIRDLPPMRPFDVSRPSVRLRAMGPLPSTPPPRSGEGLGEGAVPLLVQPDILDRDVAAGRDVDVTLDEVLHPLVLIGDEEVYPGQVGEQRLLDVDVDRRPLLDVRLRRALLDHGIDLRVRVLHAVARLAGAEVALDHVVRVDI